MMEVWRLLNRIGLGRFGVLYMNEVFCNTCHQITPLGEFKIKLTPTLIYIVLTFSVGLLNYFAC